MRVAIIITLSWDSSITKESVCFANALSRNDNVLLILRDEPSIRELNLLNKNIKIIYVRTPRVYYPTNFLMVFEIIKAINEFNPDIIHLRSASPWFYLGLIFLRKYPLVSAFDNAIPRKGEKEGFYNKIVDLIVIKLSDQIIVFGQTTKNIIANRFNVSKESIHVIPLGNYAGTYSHSMKDFADDGAKYILFFGRILKYKGLEYLMRAETLIRNEIPNAKIIIAGSCDDFRFYESLITDRNSYVLKIQWISSNMITGFFQKANVVVLPYTEYSNSGNIALAYAFKKPIVATKVGSIAEYILDGKTGYLVPPRDPKELAKAIIKILKDDELSKKMGEKGYELMKKVFSWDEILLKSKLVYERAAKIRK